jgi:GDP-4-dehydro-6-deoxy-D-mannose reductase
MRILVTGATGFAGSHLVEGLLAQGDVEVVGVARQVRPAPEWLPPGAPCKMLRCDLYDRAAVRTVLEQVRPECIYHLAGYAHAGESFLDAGAAWRGNLQATRTLYEAVIRWGASPRILYVGSGLAYGDPLHAEQVFTEEDPFRPVSPYAASKAAADLMSYQYSRAPGLDIVRVRPFNHIGPRQAPSFAIANFARQIAAMETGRQPPVVETGNLGPLRDLTDVRDTVRAYVALAARGRPGEAYNVASGEVYSMEDVLSRLLALTPVKAEVRQKSTLVRSPETWAVRASAAKLQQETGWTPRYALDQTLASTLDYWRSVERQHKSSHGEYQP